MCVSFRLFCVTATVDRRISGYGTYALISGAPDERKKKAMCAFNCYMIFVAVSLYFAQKLSLYNF